MALVGGRASSDSLSMYLTSLDSCWVVINYRRSTALVWERVLCLYLRIRVVRSTLNFLAAVRYEICPSRPCELIAAIAFDKDVMVVELSRVEDSGLKLLSCRGWCMDCTGARTDQLH
jgi:hypothetical protein